LFDGEKVVDGAIYIAKVILSEGFPENIEGIIGFLVVV
jgi:hypothetical protein